METYCQLTIRLYRVSWEQTKKLTASDAAGGDFFGFSVAISGNYAIVGAFHDDDVPSSSGSAYIFERNSNGTWYENTTQKLTASDAASGDPFGYCVAISGNYAIVSGMSNDDDGSGSGSAYIFERNSDGMWESVSGQTYRTETKKLTASDAESGDEFGRAVAISGNYAIVGGPFNDDDGTSSGSAYIFERDIDGTWNQKPKLTASDAESSDNFGRSVAISGDYAIVGAYRDNLARGSAYIFERDSNGNWTFKQKLIADDAASSDYLGWSVAISGNYAIVGAYKR